MMQTSHQPSELGVSIAPIGATTTPSWRLGIGVVVLMALGWWVTSQPPFSAAGSFGVIAAGLTVVALAWSPRVRANEAPLRTERWWVWLVLGAAVGAFELLMYLSHPRGDHPTISSIADPLQADHLMRWLFFGGWVAIGWALVRSK